MSRKRGSKGKKNRSPGPSDPPAGAERSPIENKETGCYAGPSENPPTPSPPAPNGNVPKKSPESRWLIFWTAMQAVGTVAGVVAAVIGLWYINATLNATKDALHRSERPWIEIGDLQPLTFDSVKEGDVPIEFGIPILNSGKSPAVKVMVCFDLGLSNTSAPDPAPPADPHKCLGDERHEHVIFPGSTFIYANTIKPKGRSAFLEAAQSEEKRLGVIGSVWYEDQFGLKHRTSKCFYWHAPDGIFASCTKGNYAD